jgi:hypothetical protein
VGGARRAGTQKEGTSFLRKGKRGSITRGILRVLVRAAQETEPDVASTTWPRGHQQCPSELCKAASRAEEETCVLSPDKQGGEYALWFF